MPFTTYPGMDGHQDDLALVMQAGAAAVVGPFAGPAGSEGDTDGPSGVNFCLGRGKDGSNGLGGVAEVDPKTGIGVRDGGGRGQRR